MIWCTGIPHVENSAISIEGHLKLAPLTEFILSLKLIYASEL